MCKIGTSEDHIYRSSQVSHGEPSKGSICFVCGDTHPGYEHTEDGFEEKARTPRCRNKRCARLAHDDGICLTVEQLKTIGSV